MLDTIIQAIQSIMGPIGTLGRTILGVFAMACAIATGIGSIRGFTSGDMKKGGTFLGITIIIVVVAVIIYGAVRSIGKGTGQDINSNISMLPMLALVPTYVMCRMNSKKSQAQISE